MKTEDVNRLIEQAIQGHASTRARGEKPPVKTYAGGKPNYCTPEETFILDRGCWERGCVAYDERDGDGVNISAERVDERLEKREWVGLTVNEVLELLPSSKWKAEETLLFVQRIEDELKEKNA